CLLDLAIADPAGLGGDKMLTAFAKAREPDVRLRVSGIDALNRSSIAAAPFLHSLRASGIKVLHGAAPLRHSIMKLGLGAGR
ncbi:MAG: UbiH/UbiF family hydroxylase, partial [Rhodobacteraceae bacterium]|nr:UbiH/UbiF family hydroxylase [Paracoccaceae bacterium]